MLQKFISINHWNDILISDGNTSALKYVSLITLTVQNALLGLSMRYARTREGDMFLSSTGILILLWLCAELLFY